MQQTVSVKSGLGHHGDWHQGSKSVLDACSTETLVCRSIPDEHHSTKVSLHVFFHPLPTSYI